MKTCLQCRAGKPSSEFYGYRDGTLQACCKVCVRERSRAWYAENKELALLNVSAYRQRNRDKVKTLISAWQKANPGKHSEYCKQYRAKHPKRRAETKAKWVKANRDRHTMYCASSKAAKLRSTPIWANHFFIAEIYNLAKLRAAYLGIKHHVDHIVPLQSPLVCGLHVEHNLRVIPSVLNLQKHNKVWPDMP